MGARKVRRDALGFRPPIATHKASTTWLHTRFKIDHGCRSTVVTDHIIAILGKKNKKSLSCT